ncbi:MAG: YsnF/AvaK domain-containing protein [Steroidobacter sp.]
MTEHTDETRIPIIEERARIDKQVVDRDIVRIKTTFNERTEWLTQELTSEDVVVERVPVDREIDSMPPIREEADLLVIPVIEQRLVVEKRWVLKEELHIRKQKRTDVVEVPVTLRSSDVSVERDRDA